MASQPAAYRHAEGDAGDSLNLHFVAAFSLGAYSLPVAVHVAHDSVAMTCCQYLQAQRLEGESLFFQNMRSQKRFESPMMPPRRLHCCMSTQHTVWTKNL
jgi:hypothetical protein